jgi:tetratricopeptide (TPR) repeat protein
MSVLVADFDNTTGDPSFEGALEQALVIGIEGAGFISALPPATAHRIAEQIQPGSRLDETMARLVSRREGISVILAGEIEKNDDRYLIEVRALDPGQEPAEGKPLAVAGASADSRDGVLEAVGRIASELRGDLGDSTPRSDLLAAAETFTAASLEAMSLYAKGQDLSAQGLFEEAIELYQRAVDEDPEFGRAYAGMGAAYGNLRREDAAETSYQQAFQNLDRMNDRERYRTLGGYYLLISKNFDKAIESYRNLVDAYPADAVGHSNLAFAYLSVRDFDRAVDSGRQAVALEPKNIINRINYAMYALYAGDFETAIAESKTVLEQNPDFGYALFTIGRAAGAAGDMQAAHEAFEELDASEGMGSSLAPMGHGDLALHRGRNSDAVRLLEPAVAASENPFETASMLAALAEARLALGDTEGALADARRSVELSEQESVLYFAARLLLAAGRDDEAEAIAIELENRLQSLSTSLSGLIRAELALGDGQLGTALREIRWAREEYDFWMVHFLAGLTYIQAEQYPEAFDEFDHCVRNKGEITDVFLADSATLRYFPPALYWIGRCHEALGNAEAAGDRYREYLAIRGGAEPPDELAADAAVRLRD